MIALYDAQFLWQNVQFWDWIKPLSLYDLNKFYAKLDPLEIRPPSPRVERKFVIGGEFLVFKQTCVCCS